MFNIITENRKENGRWQAEDGILVLSMRKETHQYQLSMVFANTETSLRLALEKGLGRPVSLVLTENSSSMLSARLRDGVMQVRLHEMFLTAGPDVIDEIVGFIKKRRSSIPLFRRFIRENNSHIRRKPPQKVFLKTEGRYHDLRELYEEVNREYFCGEIEAAITWGSGRARFAVRKRTLGSYSAGPNLIRINPVLDSSKVPRYFIKYVVYHEMLHAAIAIQKRGTRRCVHSAEFRRREKMFRDYERAVDWERRA
jgi:predicted metal-dependent hydrolase